MNPLRMLARASILAAVLCASLGGACALFAGDVPLSAPWSGACATPAEPNEAPVTPKECPCGKDLAGLYRMVGDVGQEAYYGAVLIWPEKDGVFRVHKIVGTSSMIGIGVRKGRSLALVWKDRDGPVGVGVYHFDPKGKTLAGSWVNARPDGRHEETLTWLSRIEDDET